MKYGAAFLQARRPRLHRSRAASNLPHKSLDIREKLS